MKKIDLLLTVMLFTASLVLADGVVDAEDSLRDYDPDAVATDEPDSTYLDSLKRARKKRYQETLERLQEDARRSVEPYIDYYIRALSDTSKDTRYIAAFELGRSQDKKVVPYLEKLLLEDPASIVRAQCAKSLSLLRSIDSQPVLIEALEDSVEEVRLQSALTLASLGDTTYCMPVFEELWQFGDRRTRRFVNIGFKDVGTERAIQNLREAMNDNDPYVAVNAAIKLAIMGYTQDAFPILKKSLYHEDPHIRRGAARGLAEIGDATSLQLIKGMLDDESPYVRQYIRTILKSYFNIEVPKPKDKNSMRDYDPDAAAAYADQWWNGWNAEDYNYYPDADCSNFVSQCLIAGGLDLSAGYDGNGGGVDDWGCIPWSDHLHLHLINYQGVTLYECISEDDWPQEPDWFVKGDPAIYNEANNPWKHAVFARSGDEYFYATLNSHTPDVYDKRVYWFYDHYSNLVSCYFYHIPSGGSSIEDNSISYINELKPNFPNPFNHSTTISFSTNLKHEKNSKIKIYNIKGRLLKQVSIDNHQPSIVWDGKDESGNQVSSGIYLYQLVIGDKVIDTKKMVLIK